MRAARRVTFPVLMANLNLLFWLSLLPFTTGWMGKNHFAQEPFALYGANLLASALSYYILQGQIVAAHGKDPRLRLALDSDLKGKGAILAYCGRIAISVMGLSMLGFSIFCTVALVWLVASNHGAGDAFIGALAAALCRVSISPKPAPPLRKQPRVMWWDKASAERLRQLFALRP
jgi:uncharacterized membrane protein